MESRVAAQEEEVRAGSLKSLSAEDVEKLAMLSVVSRALNSTGDLILGLTSVLGELLTALNGDRGFIHLFDPQGQFVQEVALDRSVQPVGSQFRYSHSLYQRCLRDSRPVLVLDVDGAASDSLVLTGIRSVMIHPLFHQNYIVGVLYLDSMVKAGRFLETDLQLLGIIADMVSVFLERTRNAAAMAAATAALEAKSEELRKANRMLAESAQETIYKLSRAAEFRDDEGGEHVQRVSHYCEAIALKLGLSRSLAARIKMASQLHDVGKVGIPDSILLKPGRFTEYEREVMKQHTIIGNKILSGSGSPVISLAAEVALTHHEKWDGTGYPFGLAGDKIPLAGRIVAVADVFDALTTERRYKTAWSLDRAMELIAQEGGSHFDPAISAAFVALREQVEDIRSRFQPANEADTGSESETEEELALQTRSQGRELVVFLQKAIETLARGEDFAFALRQQSLNAARRLTGLLGSLGVGLDTIRRLSAHFKRPDLLPEQAPRLAALLAEVEAALVEETTSLQEQKIATILLVDPDPYQRETLVIEAFNRGLTAVEAKDIAGARQAVAMRVPEMVILEVAQPETDEFLDWFCQEHPSVPLVVLSSEGVFSKRLDVARRGGAVYLHKPMPASAVFDAVDERLSRQEEQQVYRILALDDDPIVLKVLNRSLTSHGFVTQTLSDPLKLWYTLSDWPPDVLILDWEMPLVSGIDICKVLRSDPHHARLPIIVLTSHGDTETYQRALEAGADDVLVKPLEAARLGSRILNRLGRDVAVRRSSARDPLTGLMDVHSALRTAAHLFALAVRQGAPFSLCLLKIERFDELNTRFGRTRAAEVLRQTAQVLERRSRPEDILVHYRPDAFLLGLYGSASDGTEKLLNSLNARLAQEKFQIEDGFPIRCQALSVSYPEDGTLLQELLDKLNQA